MPLRQQRRRTAVDNNAQPSGNRVVGPAAYAVTSRNFTYMDRDGFKRGKTTVKADKYITSQSSPVKDSASNPATGQEQTKALVDDALRDELGGARILADDLIDQMFGSIISTELAMHVLEGLLEAGKVKVRDSRGKIPANATAALENAYERALAHGCKREGVEVIKTPSKKGKSSQNNWKWTWVGYPTGIIDESAMVDFFNEIIDASLALPCLSDVLKVRQALYRFVRPHDTDHPFPLAYGPQGEDMRPDFVVLPLQGLHVYNPDTPGGVVRYRAHEKYCNFTMIRLPGECKTSDHNTGTTQVQRYMRGTRRSQPWQRFTTAMSVTRESIGFMRGEGSGVERVLLILERGRCSLDFVRLLLGIALADEETFGKSRYFELSEEEQKLRISDPKPEELRGTAAPALASNEVLPNVPAPRRSGRIRERESKSRHGSGMSAPMSDDTSESSATGSEPRELSPPPSIHSSHSHHSGHKVSENASSHGSSHASRSSQKRKRTEDEEYVDPDTAPRANKKAAIKEAMYVVKAPTKVFGYDYKGILFNGASIRGRGTVVWAVLVASEDAGKVVALKMSWQDVARKEQRDKVLEILLSHDPHENVLRPTRLAVDEDSTLRTIRKFTSDEVENWAAVNRIEDRVLEVDIMDLARPVEFFWSIQDFVMGVRGALLGHEYLVKIGILHRDVSENNVLLALYPGAIRGYITDFDMAISYKKPESQSQEQSELGRFLPKQNVERSQPSGSSPAGGPFKAERTGTTPYMSINVLACRGHTHFDDIESFLYVIVLFFMTYTHPLPEVELRDAQSQMFSRSVTNSRRPHIKKWPSIFQAWRGEYARVFKSSFFHEDEHLDVFAAVTEDRWKDPDIVLSVGELVTPCQKMFLERPGRCVSHQEFIAVLDKWLEDHPVPPEGYNSCPFKDSEQKQLV